MRLPALIGSVIEDALNRYLAMDPDSAHRLESIQAKAIALDLRGLDLTLFILVRPPRLSVLTELEAAPDTRLRGTPLGLLSMGLGEGGARQLFGGDVEIEGDIETGQRLQAILQAVEIDWEEQISRLTGDVVAHQVGNLARGARDYWTSATDHLSRDLADYLQEEARHLPTRSEIDAFLEAVDTLRLDADRLEARVARLESVAGGAGAEQGRRRR